MSSHSNYIDYSLDEFNSLFNREGTNLEADKKHAAEGNLVTEVLGLTWGELSQRRFNN